MDEDCPSATEKEALYRNEDDEGLLDNVRRRRNDQDKDEVAHKRGRYDSEPESDINVENLLSLILKVDEKNNSSLESNLESLAQSIEADFETYKSNIVEIIIQCVDEFPEKISIYSTLVGLLNAKKYNFGAELLEKFVIDWQKKLEYSNFKHALYTVIFFSSLVNCKVISLSSYAGFLEQLLQAASEDDIPQARSDWFVYALLHSLPWIGQELADKEPKSLENYLCYIEQYIGQRNKDHTKLLQVWSTGVHEQEDDLDCLWKQIEKLRSDAWKEKFVSRHYVAFDGTLADALQHNLPKLEIPAHTEQSVYPGPKIVFRFFDYADCPEEGILLPGAHSIERFLVEEEICWILERHSKARKECAVKLLDYEKKTLVPLNYVVLEVIFSQMLRLPNSPQTQIFYSSLLIELCKTKSMPQVIAQAAEMFYQRIDTMQLMCIDRLVDWFSFHISNFEYRWSWADWGACTKLSELSPKQMFVTEVIEKCMRLSYHERVVEFLPISLESLTPEKPTICYDLDDDAHPDYESALALDKAFRSRVGALEIIEVLETNSKAEGESNALLTIFLKVLLFLAKKSFSHNFAALTRYHETLKTLISRDEQASLTVLHTIYEVWKHHRQMMIALVKKLLRMSLIDTNSIIDWVFSEQLKSVSHRLWVWEILSGALTHMSSLCQRSRTHRDSEKDDHNRKQTVLSDSELSNTEKMEVADDARPDGLGVDVQLPEENHEEIADSLKNSLVYTLRKYVEILSEHMKKCETAGIDFKNNWYLHIVGRLRCILLQYHVELLECKDAIETELSNLSSLDQDVTEIYKEFVALKV